MIGDKLIKSIIPFLVVLLTTLLVGGNPFQAHGTRLDMLRGDTKLLALLTAGPSVMVIACIVPLIIFLKAWWKNRDRKNVWYSDLLWQAAGAFFCWFLLSLMSVIGLYQMFLYINGLLWHFMVFLVGYAFMPR